MKTWVKGSILAVALVAAFGCGGGGSTGGGSAAPGSKRVAFFVSSTAGSYSHVWVNVKQATLVGTSGSVNVFTSTIGKSIDLASLSQPGKKLYAALGVGSIPQANFNKIQITVDNSVTVIPQGATQGTQNTFSGSSGATKTISIPVSSTGTVPIVANFNLAKWTVSGSQVSASGEVGDGTQVTSTGQESQDFEGTVGNLSGTAPALMFDIAGDGATTHVVCSANTVIANSDGSANPVLSNNSKVDVIGTVDPTTLALMATSVTIRVGNSAQPNRVAGTIASAGTNSFVINVNDCHGLQPNSTTVNVAITATTTFQDINGITITSSQFSTATIVGTSVSATGTYDQASNTLTATTICIRQGDQGGGNGDGNNQEVKVQGPVLTVDVANSALTMTVQEYEGALLSKGSTLNVVTTASTQFNGTTLATLTAGATLEIKGTFAGTTLTATEISAGGNMGNDGGGNGGGGGHFNAKRN